jgi:hypothetical protein
LKSSKVVELGLSREEIQYWYQVANIRTGNKKGKELLDNIGLEQNKSEDEMFKYIAKSVIMQPPYGGVKQIEPWVA